MRIDDLDTPRNRPGSVGQILTCLEAFGLHWDSEVYFQSKHLADYERFLDELACRGLTYRCECSRKSLEQSFGANQRGDNSIYPRICRARSVPAETPHAIRIITGDNEISFMDGLQGRISSYLAREHGDFILKRKDGIFAYQFAVVIDDYVQRVNHVVRGSDLLPATAKQIYLQQLLNLPKPEYKHVPVIVDGKGYKLSKQTLAMAVDTKNPAAALFKLLLLLKQDPPLELKTAKVAELLAWAIRHWQAERLSLMSEINESSH